MVGGQSCCVQVTTATQHVVYKGGEAEGRTSLSEACNPLETQLERRKEDILTSN